MVGRIHGAYGLNPPSETYASQPGAIAAQASVAQAWPVAQMLRSVDAEVSSAYANSPVIDAEKTRFRLRQKSSTVGSGAKS